MSGSLLLDLCVEQDRILDARLADPPADAGERGEWLVESVVALAAHVDFLVRTLRTVPDGRVSEPVPGLIRTTLAMIDRLKPYASAAQVVELARLRRALADATAVGGPSRVEAIAMVQAGQGMELEEAFAGLAGVSTAEWVARVAAHRPSGDVP